MSATVEELRSMIEYAPPAQRHNPDAPLYWAGAIGALCQGCASRLIGRGFGSELRGWSPVYRDKAPELLPTCLVCHYDVRPEWEREGDCCELAERQFCVCLRSTMCPKHGNRCRGSHE